MPTNLGEVSARERKAQVLPPIEMTILLVCVIIFLCMLMLLFVDQSFFKSSNRTVGATLREQSRNPPRRILPDHRQNSAARFVHSPGREPIILLAAYRDRDHVEAATSSKLTIGTGDQDDAIALAPASNMTATDLEVSEIAVHRHRCHLLAHSHTLKIHGHLPGSSVFGPNLRTNVGCVVKTS